MKLNIVDNKHHQNMTIVSHNEFLSLTNNKTNLNEPLVYLSYQSI